MQSLHDKLAHTHRLLTPVDEHERLAAGEMLEDASAEKYWTQTEVLVVGGFLLLFWGLACGILYLLLPYIAGWLE